MGKVIIKRALTVIMCVCVFCSSFTLTVFAADTFNINDVLDTQYANWSELPDDFKNLGNAYVKLFSDSDNMAKLFDNASDIPISWFKVLKDGTPILSPVSKVFYWLDEAGNLFVNNLTNSEGTHHVGGGSGRHRGDVVVPSETVKEHITEANKLFFPKNTCGKMSFRTDKRWHNKYDGVDGAKYTILSLYDSFNGFQAVGGNEMYLVFFYKTADETYYHTIQWHFTVTPEEIWATDRDEVETTYYHFVTEYWNMIEGSSDKTTTNDFSGTYDYFNGSYRPLTTNTNEYFAIDYGNARFTFSSKYADYINYGECGYTLSGINPGTYSAYTSDLSKSLNIDPALFTNFDITSEVADIGYVASSTPIETIYKVDTTKIPDNYYITIEGDTLYDYSITNPETGQSDTINNYITNNYTYITNPDDNNSGGGSGTVGGNVTVGGKVDIGGSVGVDINVSVPDININVNTNNGGGVESGSDLSVPSTDVFNSYYEEALDDSSGFRRFLEYFFGFLPPEITLLLGIGLTFVILARIFGR